jgi:hypothetical protein
MYGHTRTRCAVDLLMMSEREVPLPQLCFLSKLLHRSARPLLARKVEVSKCELSGDVFMLEAPLKVAA